MLTGLGLAPESGTRNVLIALEPTHPELTTRDVLSQINRCLELIEGDLRDLRQESNDDAHSLRREFRGEIALLRQELNSRFYWIIGLVLVSWLSTMGTMLLKP